MITVEIIKNNDAINRITLKGHALFDEVGKDIVCASATTAAIITANAIERLHGTASIRSEADNGRIDLLIKDTMNETIQTLLRNLIVSLEELETQYSDYIKILK